MFLMMFIAIAMISCSKDDPVESTPTITLTISSENVPYGSNITVSWTSTNAKTVTLNGEAVATSGSKDYSNMILTTKFSATATNVVKTASVEKTVTVGDEPIPVVTMITTPNDALLPYGNKVTLTWAVTGAKTVTLDGVVVTATGTKVVQPLANTTYVLKAVNVTKETTVSKVVTVSAWNTTKFGLLTHNGGKWVLNRFETFQNGIVVANWPLGLDEIGRYMVYSLDGTWMHYDVNNASLGNGTWELTSNDTQLKWTSVSGGPITIINVSNLTETELSFSEDVYSNGLPAKFVRTWRIQ